MVVLIIVAMPRIDRFTTLVSMAILCILYGMWSRTHCRGNAGYNLSRGLSMRLRWLPVFCITTVGDSPRNRAIILIKNTLARTANRRVGVYSSADYPMRCTRELVRWPILVLFGSLRQALAAEQISGEITRSHWVSYTRQLFFVGLFPASQLFFCTYTKQA